MGGSTNTNTYFTQGTNPYPLLFIPMRKYAQLKTHLISKIVREGWYWWVLQRYYHHCCYILQMILFPIPIYPHHPYPTIYSLNMEGMWQPIKLALYACMHPPITTPENRLLFIRNNFYYNPGASYVYKLLYKILLICSNTRGQKLSFVRTWEQLLLILFCFSSGKNVNV